MTYKAQLWTKTTPMRVEDGTRLHSQVGCYLVRESANKHDTFVLDVKDANDAVRHYQIKRTPNGGYCISRCVKMAHSLGPCAAAVEVRLRVKENEIGNAASCQSYVRPIPFRTLASMWP
jgi:hypothetical protein